MEEKAGLDTFTRRYLTGLLIVMALGLLWWLASWDRQVSQLNAILEADAEIAAYPYPFKVISLESGIAEISSPRSADVPVITFLRTIDPALRKLGVMEEAVMAAQAKLVAVQSRVGKLVNEQPNVTSIRWSLDSQWYKSHGIYLD